MANLEELKEAIIKGKRKEVPDLVQAALDDNVPPGEIINDYMIEALKIVGERFEAKKIFVPEMMIAAKAMQAGLDIIKPLIEESQGDESSLGTVVIGTVFGDLHDIGKNLVILMLESSGFKVYNIGENVSPEDFLAKAQEMNADIVGMSSLLTTGDPYVKSTVDVLKSSDANGFKIICGGAAVTEKFAIEECGADGYAPDAVSAVRVAKQLLGLNEN